MESLDDKPSNKISEAQVNSKAEKKNQETPRSRDSLGPRGFTSMVNLVGNVGKGNTGEQIEPRLSGYQDMRGHEKSIMNPQPGFKGTRDLQMNTNISPREETNIPSKVRNESSWQQINNSKIQTPATSLQPRLTKSESLPLDSLSVRSSACSCTSGEDIPKPVMSDSKKTKVEYLGCVPTDSKATH